jgi:hypothetical protein
MDELIIYLIPFTLIYFLTVLMVHLNDGSGYPVTLWTYFPIAIFHEILGVWLVHRNPIYKNEKWIGTILVLLIIFKTALLFGYRSNLILFFAAFQLSIEMRKFASQ